MTQAALTIPVGVFVLIGTGCSSSSSEDTRAAASSSVAAALSSAAQASPGEYGSPVDPAMPNPTDVATDAPAGTVTGTTAPVVVTYSGWVDESTSVEVGAFVPGVVESGGTCTLRLTGGAGAVTMSTTAEADADSTSCPTLAVPRSELVPGSYSGEVSYSSGAVSGVSAAFTVVVP